MIVRKYSLAQIGSVFARTSLTIFFASKNIFKKVSHSNIIFLSPTSNSHVIDYEVQKYVHCTYIKISNFICALYFSQQQSLALWQGWWNRGVGEFTPPPPVFGRSVKPFSTGGADFCRFLLAPLRFSDLDEPSLLSI